MTLKISWTDSTLNLWFAFFNILLTIIPSCKVFPGWKLLKNSIHATKNPAFLSDGMLYLTDSTIGVENFGKIHSRAVESDAFRHRTKDVQQTIFVHPSFLHCSAELLLGVLALWFLLVVRRSMM